MKEDKYLLEDAHNKYYVIEKRFLLTKGHTELLILVSSDFETNRVFAGVAGQIVDELEQMGLIIHKKDDTVQLSEDGYSFIKKIRAWKEKEKSMTSQAQKSDVQEST